MNDDYWTKRSNADGFSFDNQPIPEINKRNES